MPNWCCVSATINFETIEDKVKFIKYFNNNYYEGGRYFMNKLENQEDTFFLIECDLFTDEEEKSEELSIVLNGDVRWSFTDKNCKNFINMLITENLRIESANFNYAECNEDFIGTYVIKRGYECLNYEKYTSYRNKYLDKLLKNNDDNIIKMINCYVKPENRYYYEETLYLQNIYQSFRKSLTLKDVKEMEIYEIEIEDSEEEYRTLRVKQLKILCKERKLKRYSKLRKQELIDILVLDEKVCEIDDFVEENRYELMEKWFIMNDLEQFDGLY